MLYFYNGQIRPEKKYPCHIWTRAVVSSLSRFGKVQNCLHALLFGDGFIFPVCKPFPHRCNIASLSLLYPIATADVQMSFILYFHQFWPLKLVYTTSTFLRGSKPKNFPHRHLFLKNWNFAYLTSVWVLPWRLQSWHRQVKGLIHIILISHHRLFRSISFTILTLPWWLSSLVLGVIYYIKRGMHSRPPDN